jgi:hypothetical protein
MSSNFRSQLLVFFTIIGLHHQSGNAQDAQAMVDKMLTASVVGGVQIEDEDDSDNDRLDANKVDSESSHNSASAQELKISLGCYTEYMYSNGNTIKAAGFGMPANAFVFKINITGQHGLMELPQKSYRLVHDITVDMARPMDAKNHRYRVVPEDRLFKYIFFIVPPDGKNIVMGQQTPGAIFFGRCKH